MKIPMQLDVQQVARGYFVTIQSGTRYASYLCQRAPSLAAAQCWALLVSVELVLANYGGQHDIEVRCSFSPDRRQHYWRMLQLRLAQGGTTLHLVREETDIVGAGASWWRRWISPAQALA